ncbi:TonB-dependent receptor domain-containing protein [Sphingobacterium haloxyli]|uniref:TonB-dependent receptor n=1 Tax=Sphingobacterium haloxyli TaxID=2100533 RepID=A0A2S9J229_9SPHI|nr:TonB-dependent receptor [Sphingobacterium haloxyli]PRD46838.1 TonB-dependent receptor [Sphingobacterium haloxyli]
MQYNKIYTAVLWAMVISVGSLKAQAVRRDTSDTGIPQDRRLIDSVVVHGRTQVQEVNRQPYNVTALDAKSLHNTTLDLSHALDRVSGVRVRETGGVGSNINFSLNGFSGNHVRFFLDGVPIDNMGTSFQINNIPINFADRVEVYKGVVPIWLGSDALGGAVNIVSSRNIGNYVDVSYSYGSFNTHRTAINAGMTSKTGFTLQLSAFQNYSDNNYWVTLDEASDASGQYFRNQRLRRFHDQYHNETLVAKLGVVNKAYADRLLLGMTVGQNYKEMQTGARMASVFGDWHRRGNLLMPSLTYQKKDLLLEGLDVTLNANYNFGEERSIDTVALRYYWIGEPTETGRGGGERDGGLYRYRNNNGLATATVNYRINENQQVTLNNVFNTFDRKGENELNPNQARYNVPKKTNKNILGAGYIYDVADKWNISVFGKFYHQTAVTDTLGTDPATKQEFYQEARKSHNYFGYGTAASYFLNPKLQLKGSYEKSIRLPESDELYGDVENLEGNYRLKPESSHNANLGLSYFVSLHDAHHFSFSGSAIYRYSTDYIYRILNNNQSKYVPANLDGVSNMGGDVEVRYSFRDLLIAGANFTYQNVRNEQKYEPGYTSISPVYQDRMPNLPYAFGNADASLFLKDFGGKGNRLSIGYNLLYVHQFYLYWPSRGGDKKFVPQQLAHDANITYTMQNGRYNIALECKNLTDALLYDNFSLQKPSRGFYIKFRYFLHNQ